MALVTRGQVLAEKKNPPDLKPKDVAATECNLKFKEEKREVTYSRETVIKVVELILLFSPQQGSIESRRK